MSKPILIVEDSEQKYRDIERVITDSWDKQVDLTRASTITDAEQAIATRFWAGIVLDVSMDITSSSAGPRQGGHATTGGLSIARKMFLTGRTAPTVIVTAFSSFQGRMVERGRFVMIGLEEVQARAMEALQSNYLGCVRYNDVGWDDDLIATLKPVVEQ